MDYLHPDGDSLPVSTTPGRISSSSMSSGLSHGMRFMSRDRPYPCPVCGKRFTQKAHLIIHKRTHTGEKPYACHICHKRFAQSSHLTVHKRVHTGEKPFFCNFCGMGFCRRPRLEAHILQHVVKEGREFPSSMKRDNALNGLSMVGLDRGGGPVPVGGDRVNQESLDAAAQLMELKMKGGFFPQVKFEPEEDRDDDDHDDVGHSKDGHAEMRRSSSRGGFGTGLSIGAGGAVIDVDDGKHNASGGCSNSDSEDGANDDVEKRLRRKDAAAKGSGRAAGDLLDLSADDLEKQSSGLTELTDLQKQALSQTLLMASPKGNFNSLLTSPHHHHHHQHHHQAMSGHAMMSGPGLTMTGLVRTNSRVSLIDFTAEDIMQHLLSRDDVKSCDFCCVVFKDPAMYYLHRSMHDKMDVRCCNLCGKLMKDKYDFTAHFLNQHK